MRVGDTRLHPREMPKTPPHSSGWLLLAALALLEPTPASAAGPVVPLDPEIAEDLGVLGPGVVGQPVPPAQSTIALAATVD